MTARTPGPWIAESYNAEGSLWTIRRADGFSEFKRRDWSKATALEMAALYNENERLAKDLDYANRLLDVRDDLLTDLRADLKDARASIRIMERNSVCSTGPCTAGLMPGEACEECGKVCPESD